EARVPVIRRVRTDELVERVALDVRRDGRQRHGDRGRRCKKWMGAEHRRYCYVDQEQPEGIQRRLAIRATKPRMTCQHGICTQAMSSGMPVLGAALDAND